MAPETIYAPAKARPVLIIEDEPANTAALEEALAQYEIPFETVSSLQDGLSLILEAQESEVSYGAVILDNHFSEEDDIYEAGEIQGVDFAAVLLGTPRNRAQFDYIREVFPRGEEDPAYHALADTYEGRVVLFTGSATLEAFADPSILDGIPVVEKVIDEEDGRCCEEGVLDFLREAGYRVSNTFDFANYKRREGLTEGIGDDGGKLEDSRSFLMDSGEMTPAEVEALFACE